MIFFIRNKENRTIVDIECLVKSEDGLQYVDVSCSVDISNYSKFLLDNISRKDDIIEDFGFLDNIRGWFWEVYLMGNSNNPEDKSDIEKQIKDFVLDTAKKYELNFVVD